MKFRKKPVVVEAVQFFERDLRGVALQPPAVVCRKGDCMFYGPHIHTLEGLMHLSDGDWIITGIKGEHYPCKPDIFEATYEAVEEG